MFIKKEGLASAASVEWDVIVIGAGAVGLIVAVCLARANKRVLLLESGSTDPGDAKDLNDVLVTGRPHLGATHGRARTIGGTTTLWGGQLTRFVPYDFAAREIMPDCRWPLGYEDLEVFYTKVAAMLDLDPRYLTDVSVQRLIGANVLHEAAGCEVFFTRWLQQSNLGLWFAKELAAHACLTVAPECHATQILCAADGARILGVRAAPEPAVRLDFRARDVVLACGTIEISRLLLLTALKEPQAAWARNPNIGQYFQDHLDLVIGQIELKNRRAFANLFENVLIDGHKYQPKIRMQNSVLQELGCLNIACTARFDSAIGEDIDMLKQFVRSLLKGGRIDRPFASLKRIFTLGPVWFPLIWRYVRHRRILAMADRGISVIAHCEQRPMKNSQISLDATRKDRFGDPLGRLDWVVDEALQMRSLQAFGAQLQEFLRTGCDADLKLEPAIAAGDTAILAQATDSYHQCGGARMSSSEAMGVVDSNCRVHGTENLHVAGAATFPSASFANPTYTAMALAYRLATHLIAQHRTVQEQPC